MATTVQCDLCGGELMGLDADGRYRVMLRLADDDETFPIDICPECAEDLRMDNQSTLGPQHLDMVRVRQEVIYGLNKIRQEINENTIHEGDTEEDDNWDPVEYDDEEDYEWVEDT